MYSEKNITKIFDLPFIGHHFLMPRIVSREGGQQTSESLRTYYREKYKVDVGLYTYGCFDPDLNYAMGGEIFIGRYCSFAKGVRYFGANHPIDAVIMSPYFYNKSFGFEVKDVKRAKIIIGHGVWCGYGALITSRCTIIGNGAVIAAGSVVTRDVPPYAVVAGNPAKIIKYRFCKEVIDQIEESKWWDATPEHLIKFYQYLFTPEIFCNHLQV